MSRSALSLLFVIFRAILCYTQVIVLFQQNPKAALEHCNEYLKRVETFDEQVPAIIIKCRCYLMLNNASAAVVLLDSAIKRCSFDSVVLVSVRFQEVAYYAFEQPYFPLKASKCLFCLPPLPVHRESSFFQCLHITISLRKFNIKRNKTLLLDSTI